MKNVFLLLVVCITSLGLSCCTQKDAVEVSGFFTTEELNTHFANGAIAISPSTAATLVYFDESGSFVDYQTYSQANDEVKSRYTVSALRTTEFLSKYGDDAYQAGYIKPLPMGQKEMYLYDYYADREKRLTLEQEQAFLLEIESNIATYLSNNSNRIGNQAPDGKSEDKEEDITGKSGGARNCTNGATQVWNDRGERLQSGDMFFQWGNMRGNCPVANTPGASNPGHISVVKDNDSHRGRLDGVWIVEAWAGDNWNLFTNSGAVEQVRAHCTWGSFRGTMCTNYWANAVLQNHDALRSTMDNWLNTRVNNGNTYGYWSKSNNCASNDPNVNHAYYCSLLAWQVYKNVLCWDIDYDGGSIVYPNDIHNYCYTQSNIVGRYAFVYGDF